MAIERRIPGDGFLHRMDVPLQIERVKVSTPWSMQNYHYHDYIELYYLYSGSRHYFINDKVHKVVAGELVTVCPYDIHATAASEEREYERVLISFGRDFFDSFGDGYASELFAFLTEGSRVIRFTPKERAWIEGMLDYITDKGREFDMGADLFIKNSLACILLLLNKKTAREEDVPAKMSDGALLVSRVSGYVNKNFAEQLTLSALSERFFVSPSYLSRLFGRITGTTLTEYINAVRIKEAKGLISSTTLSVAQVAERTGFSSLTHFERVFKKIARMTPIDFRKNK